MRAGGSGGPRDASEACGVTGKQLQDAIVSVAHPLGYVAAHFSPAQVRPGTFVTSYAYDGKGFPDLVLVSAQRRRIIFAEVKGRGDSLRPEQAEWLRSLGLAGAEAYVFTVADWRSGSIEEVLKRPTAVPRMGGKQGFSEQAAALLEDLSPTEGKGS